MAPVLRRSPRLNANAGNAAPVPAAVIVAVVPPGPPQPDPLDSLVPHVPLRELENLLARMAVGPMANDTVQKVLGPFETLVLTLKVSSKLMTRQLFEDRHLVQGGASLKVCLEVAKVTGQVLGAFQDPTKNLYAFGSLSRALAEVADCTADVGGPARDLAIRDQPLVSLRQRRRPRRPARGRVAKRKRTTRQAALAAQQNPVAQPRQATAARPRQAAAHAVVPQAPVQASNPRNQSSGLQVSSVSASLPAPPLNPAAPAVNSRPVVHASIPSLQSQGSSSSAAIVNSVPLSASQCTVNLNRQAQTSRAAPPALVSVSAQNRTSQSSQPAANSSIAQPVIQSALAPRAPSAMNPAIQARPTGAASVSSGVGVANNRPINVPASVVPRPVSGIPSSVNNSTSVLRSSAPTNQPAPIGSRQASFGSPHSSQSSSPSVMEMSRASTARSNDSMNTTGRGSYAPIAGSLLVTPPLAARQNRNAGLQQASGNDTWVSDVGSVLNLTGSTASDTSTPRSNAVVTPSVAGSARAAQDGTPTSRNTSSSSLPTSVLLTGASSLDRTLSVRGSGSSLGVSPLALSSVTSSPGTPSAVLLTDSSVGTTASSRSIPRMGNLSGTGSPVVTNSATARVPGAVNADGQSSHAALANSGPRSLARNEQRPASTTGVQNVSNVPNQGANRPQSAAGALMRADGHAQYPYHQNSSRSREIRSSHERSFGASTPRTDDGVSPMQRYARERAAALAASGTVAPAAGSGLIPSDSVFAANTSAVFSGSPGPASSDQGISQRTPTGTPVSRKRGASSEGRSEGETEEKRSNAQ